MSDTLPTLSIIGGTGALGGGLAARWAGASVPPKMERAAEQLGLPLAREGFADRQYDDDGNLTSRKLEGAVIKDPAVATEHVIRMVRDGEIISRNGKSLSRKVDTICVHGDEPTAVVVAQAVRDGLQEASNA